MDSYLRLIMTLMLCVAILTASHARIPGIPCECPSPPSAPNAGVKIVDADLGRRQGDAGCDLAEKRTSFEWNENVQLRLVVHGGKSLSDSDAQIVVKWKDPDGEVTPVSLCLEPSDSYRTCARKRASKKGEWQVTTTDCGDRELMVPIKYQVTQ